jgi:hypothetical protein
MELIDAAVAWQNHAVRQGYRLNQVEGDLSDAVVRYCAYGLAEPRFTRTVHSAPDTSHEAGEWMKQFALTDAAKVFRAIFYAWQLDRSALNFDNQQIFSGGMTCDEVEHQLNRTHQSISARVNQLRDTGWIVDSGTRRNTRSGRKAIVWTPTVAALDLVDRVGLPIPTTTERSINARSDAER